MIDKRGCLSLCCANLHTGSLESIVVDTQDINNAPPRIAGRYHAYVRLWMGQRTQI